jgi:hypothetical protein
VEGSDDRLHGSAEVFRRYIHFVTEELSISETNYAGLRGRPRFADLYYIERGWAIGMMGNGWGWGMGFGSGWVFMIIIAILVVLGIVYFMKRR